MDRLTTAPSSSDPARDRTGLARNRPQLALDRTTLARATIGFGLAAFWGFVSR